MKLGTLKDFLESICFNGDFSVQIVPLRQIKEPRPHEITLMQDEDEARWGVLNDKRTDEEIGSQLLTSLETYDWPLWARNEELHVTIEAI